VTATAREQSLLRDDLEQAGVRIWERAGLARFTDAHTVQSDHAPRLHADKVILCTGGTSRPLPVPGFELTATHSDAWNLSSVPPSLLVIGAGATGVQVASIFNAFGSRVHLVEVAPRILMSEDREVSEAVGAALAASGVSIIEDASRWCRSPSPPTRTPWAARPSWPRSTSMECGRPLTSKQQSRPAWPEPHFRPGEGGTPRAAAAAATPEGA
jgi:Pyridine nucleotide-disulphide oxidoreductase